MRACEGIRVLLQANEDETNFALDASSAHLHARMDREGCGFGEVKGVGGLGKRERGKRASSLMMFTKADQLLLERLAFAFVGWRTVAYASHLIRIIFLNSCFVLIKFDVFFD